MSSVTNSVVLQGDPGELFDLVTTAQYWTRWHPATTAVSGQTKSPMQVGDVIHETAMIGGVTVQGNWVVSVAVRPTRLVLEMPATCLGDLRITYALIAVSDGVEFSRTLEYDLSGLPEGWGAVIDEQMRTDSERAVQQLGMFAQDMQVNAVS